MMFWVSIEVHLEKPLSLVDEEGTRERAALVGFVQELGCTADDRRAMEDTVRAHIGGYELAVREVVFSDVEELEHDDLDDELRARTLRDPEAHGVWFTTGRSFYSEEGSS